MSSRKTVESTHTLRTGRGPRAAAYVDARKLRDALRATPHHDARMRLVSAASQGSGSAVLAEPEPPAHRGLPDVGTVGRPGTVPHPRRGLANHGQRRSPP